MLGFITLRESPNAALGTFVYETDASTLYLVRDHFCLKPLDDSRSPVSTQSRRNHDEQYMLVAPLYPVLACRFRQQQRLEQARSGEVGLPALVVQLDSFHIDQLLCFIHDKEVTTCFNVC